VLLTGTPQCEVRFEPGPACLAPFEFPGPSHVPYVLNTCGTSLPNDEAAVVREPWTVTVATRGRESSDALLLFGTALISHVEPPIRPSPGRSALFTPAAATWLPPQRHCMLARQRQASARRLAPRRARCPTCGAGEPARPTYIKRTTTS
jgi:hypothetical protein